MPPCIYPTKKIQIHSTICYFLIKNDVTLQYNQLITRLKSKDFAHFLTKTYNYCTCKKEVPNFL